MAYQTFDDEKGDSRSLEKLERLQLPDDMTGKSVLDLGCNEGFFCLQALKRGASRVVGYDANPAFIESARKRIPEGVFHAKTWWELDDEKFDFILFLSAIHYEREQKKLLSELRRRLKPGGTLILEGGVDMDYSKTGWKWVRRFDGLMKFPSVSYLMDELLEGFSARIVGPSVDQDGDPQPRYVVHCSIRKPTLLLVYGESKAGKTNFARLFSRKGVKVLHLDVIIGHVIQLKSVGKPNILDYLRSKMEETNFDIWQLLRKIEEDQKEQEVAKLIYDLMIKDDEFTVVEGYLLKNPTLREYLVNYAKKGGYKIAETQLTD